MSTIKYNNIICNKTSVFLHGFLKCKTQDALLILRAVKKSELIKKEGKEQWRERKKSERQKWEEGSKEVKRKEEIRVQKYKRSI